MLGDHFVLDADLFDVDVFVLGGFGRSAALLSRPFVDQVSLGVFGQVIGTHEPLAAVGAGETFLARVRPQVPLEFVRTSEALAAEQPLTAERPLACVPAQMGLQVRCFAVDFSTAWNVTQVLLLLMSNRSSCFLLK